MNRSGPFKFVLAGLLIGAAAVTLGLLHLDNNRLRRLIAQREAQHRPSVEARAENARLKNLLVSAAQNSEAAAASLRTQVTQAREEIAALETRAAKLHAEKIARTAREAAALATNRDVRQGLVRLEFLQDRGQLTPTAAFETLIWAALRGNQNKLGELGIMPAETRDRAKALIARLPDDARAAWTPEKLATLWLTGAVVDMIAVHVTGETIVEADQARVTFRAPPKDDEEEVKFKFTPNGWRAVVSTAAIDKLEKKLRPTGAKQ